MPNGRSGGFHLERNEFVQLLSKCEGDTVVGKTLQKPVTTSDLRRILDQSEGQQILVEEQDRAWYIVHLSEWVTVGCESPLFGEFRRYQAQGLKKSATQDRYGLCSTERPPQHGEGIAPCGDLSEQLRILLDPGQPMDHRQDAAAYIRRHGDRKTLDALIPIVKGPWEKEDDPFYLAFRRLVAISCYQLWTLRVKDGPPVFSYYPEIASEVEATLEPGRVRRGRLTTGGVGTSLFDFHYEYPVWSPERDFVKGHPKDQIFVLEPRDSRIPIFDWCRQRQATVICNRCGEDITYQVTSFGCRSLTQKLAPSAGATKSAKSQ